MPAIPSPQRLSAIHKRLIAGDAAAPAEAAELIIPALAEALRIGRRGLRDEAMACDAATDAVLGFAKAPQTYKPDRSGVWTFLHLAARRNLANLIVKERRQRGRIIRFAAIALRDPARKKTQESVLSALVENEEARALRDRLNSAVAGLPPDEAAVLELLSNGIRATAEYARVLGIDHRPAEEQKRVVKNMKDRLLKRLKRSLSDDHDG